MFQNNEKGLSYMKKLWSEIVENGHQPMRRAIGFAAALAVSQNAPHIAIEIISSLPKHNYVTLRNLKVIVMCICFYFSLNLYNFMKM